MSSLAEALSPVYMEIMPRIRTKLKALVALLLMLSPNAMAAELNHAREYARCMERAPSDPNDAFELATAWKGLGGGDAAEHCAAVSLLYAGQPEHAARRLEVLAQTIVAEPEFKGQILAQAGQAWLLHGDASRADAALTSALRFMPRHPDILIDRAQARFAATDYAGARDDLTVSIESNPQNPDAFIFRATAHRFMNLLDRARADIETALLLVPDEPTALLESGILHRLNGDDGAARIDWLRVLELDPEGEAASMARTNIEKMDVVVDN